MSVCDDILELAASGDQGIENRPEFLAHLKACAHCRDEAPGMLSAARTIRSVPAPALTGHLTPDQIVALALDSVPAAETADRRLAQHITGCATCAAEVREVQRAEEARSSIVSGRSGLASRIRHVLASLTSTASQGMPARLALAAGLAVLLLAYPAFLGMRRLPRLQGEMSDLASRTRQLETQVRDLSAALATANQTAARLSGWSKPLRLFGLTSPVRGQRTLPSIRVDAAVPYVLLSVRPLVVDPTGDAEVYRVVLLDSEDREVWRSELSVGEMREQMKSSGALILPIAPALLTPGRHALRVFPRDAPRQLILEVPFEVVSAQSPTATNPAQ